MELDVYLKQRFDRLRNIVQLREKMIKDMEHQVIHYFEQGNFQEIEILMNKKNVMMSTNHQLSQFIYKWEGKAEVKEPLYTSI